MKRAVSVDEYFESATNWREELERLRNVLVFTGLTEELKWGAPCYTFDGTNIVGLAGYKHYFGLWFFQGALIDDKECVLINAQQVKTRAMRQWRMTDKSDIRPAVIRSYVKQAKANVSAGRTVGPKRRKKLVIPRELKNALTADNAHAECFSSLRPAQQPAIPPEG